MTPYVIVDVEQGTPEWLQARAGKITGSRARDVRAKPKGSAAEATGRRNYRAQLAAECLSGRPVPAGYQSRAMQDGHLNEPYARFAHTCAIGEPVRKVGFIHLPTIRAGCSPDGLLDDDELGPGFAEYKCPTLAIHLEYLNRQRLPPEYIDQVVHNFWITGANFCDFASFNPLLPKKLQFMYVRVLRTEVKKELEVYTGEAMQFLAELTTLEKQLLKRAA